MEGMIKHYLRGTSLFRPLRMLKGYAMVGVALATPDKPGKAVPWLYKIITIKKYGKKFGLSILIETGTNMGETIDGCRNAFADIYSVELAGDLHLKARERFKQYPHIHLSQGDSAAFLRDFLPGISQPALFWLDAHYSGGDTARGDMDCPVAAELLACFSNWRKGSVILIDDARCFDGTWKSYPSIPAIEALAKKYRPELTVTVERDIIRIC